MEQNNSVLYLLSALCHISTYMISFAPQITWSLRTLSLSSLVEKGSDDKDFKFNDWLSVANAGDSMELLQEESADMGSDSGFTLNSVASDQWNNFHELCLLFEIMVPNQNSAGKFYDPLTCKTVCQEFYTSEKYKPGKIHNISFKIKLRP